MLRLAGPFPNTPRIVALLPMRPFPITSLIDLFHSASSSRRTPGTTRAPRMASHLIVKLAASHVAYGGSLPKHVTYGCAFANAISFPIPSLIDLFHSATSSRRAPGNTRAPLDGLS